MADQTKGVSQGAVDEMQKFLNAEPDDIAARILSRQGYQPQLRKSAPVGTPAATNVQEELSLIQDPTKTAQRMATDYGVTREFPQPDYPVTMEDMILWLRSQNPEFQKTPQDLRREDIERKIKQGVLPAGALKTERRYKKVPTERGMITMPYDVSQQTGYTLGLTERLPTETPEERKLTQMAAQKFLTAEGATPSRTQVAMDIPGQFLTRSVNAATFFVPELIHKAVFKEDLPAPLSTAGNVAAATGELVGMFGGPKAGGFLDKIFMPKYSAGKIDRLLGIKNAMSPRSLPSYSGLARRALETSTMGGRAFRPSGELIFKAVEKSLGGWTPKTVVGEMTKRMVASTMSMAAITAMSTNQGDDVAEIMWNKVKSLPEGAAAGLVFGGANFVNFTKAHPAISWLVRMGITDTLLDLKNGQGPFDERQLWEKLLSYGMNAYVTRPGAGRNPNEINAFLKMARAEAARIDRYNSEEHLEPITRETLEQVLRQHAANIEAKKTGRDVQPDEILPPSGSKGMEFMQNLQRLTGEAKPKFVEGQTMATENALNKLAEFFQQPGVLSEANRQQLDSILNQARQGLQPAPPAPPTQAGPTTAPATSAAPTATPTAPPPQPPQMPTAGGTVASAPFPTRKVTTVNPNGTVTITEEPITPGAPAPTAPATSGWSAWRIDDLAVVANNPQNTYRAQDVQAAKAELAARAGEPLANQSVAYLQARAKLVELNFPERAGTTQTAPPAPPTPAPPAPPTSTPVAAPSAPASSAFGAIRKRYEKTTFNAPNLMKYFNDLGVTERAAQKQYARWAYANFEGWPDFLQAEGVRVFQQAPTAAAPTKGGKKAKAQPVAPPPVAPAAPTALPEQFPTRPTQPTAPTPVAPPAPAVAAPTLTEGQTRLWNRFKDRNWNNGAILEFYEMRGIKDRKAALALARKAYEDHKATKWEGLFRAEFGGMMPKKGGKKGGPAPAAPPVAPPAAPAPQTPPPPVSPTGAAPVAPPRAAGAVSTTPFPARTTRPSASLKVGDVLYKKNGKVEGTVVDNSDPSLVEVETPLGGRYKQGRAVVDADLQNGNITIGGGAPFPTMPPSTPPPAPRGSTEKKTEVPAAEIRKPAPVAPKGGMGPAELAKVQAESMGVPKVALRDPVTGKEYDAVGKEKSHGEIADRLIRQGIDISNFESGWRDIDGKFYASRIPPSRETKPVAEEPIPMGEEEVSRVAGAKTERGVVVPARELVWGEKVEGGVPDEHVNFTTGQIWKKGKKSARVVSVNSDEPWSAYVGFGKGNNRDMTTFDMWKEGWRPEGFKGGKTVGYTAPPTVSISEAVDTRVVAPESTPRRGRRPREGEENLPTPLRPGLEVEVGLPARTTGRAPTIEELEATKGRGRAVSEGDFASIEKGATQRTFDDVYQEILADPRFAPDVPKLWKYVMDTIDNSLKLGRTSYKGVPVSDEVVTRLQNDVLDAFVQEFEPGRVKFKPGEPQTLQKAVEKYLNRWISKQKGREVFREGEFVSLDTGISGEGAMGEPGEEIAISDVAEEASAFKDFGISGPQGKQISLDAQTRAEERARMEQLSEARRERTAQVINEFRKSLPSMGDVQLFNEFLDGRSVGANNEQIYQKIARQLGISDSTAYRRLFKDPDSIQNRFIRFFEKNPELRKEFIEGAYKTEDYWANLAKQGEEARAIERADWLAKQEKLGVQAFDLEPGETSPELQRAMTEAAQPQRLEGEVVEPVVFKRRVHRKATPPGTEGGEGGVPPTEVPSGFPRRKGEGGVIGGRLAARPLSTTVEINEEIGKTAEEFLKTPERPDGKLDKGFQRVKYAVGKILEPGPLHIADPNVQFLGEMMDKAWKAPWQMIHKSWEKGFMRAVRDAVRQPFWSEKYHNLTTVLLNQEGEASKITEQAYRSSKQFFRLPEESKKNINKVLEIEDMTESLITNKGSKAAKQVAAEGITLTPAEKMAYRGVREAFDNIVLKDMPRLMKKAGFSKTEIAKIVSENYREGYFPHFRYGDYAIAYIAPVKGEKGVRYRRFVESFETEAERTKRIAEIPKTFKMSDGRTKGIGLSEFKFSETRMDPNAFVQLMEAWPVAQRMIDKAGREGKLTPGELKAVEVMKKINKDVIQATFAKGRFAQRRGRMGWSKDYERAMKDYFEQVPFSLARRYLRHEVEAEMAKFRGRDLDAAKGQYDFWSGAGTKEGKGVQYMKRAIYNYYLMYKPAFFLQNITQRVSTHLPLAIAEAQKIRTEGGEAHGVKSSIQAQKDELSIYGNVIGNAKSGKPMNVETVIKDHPGFSNIEKKVIIDLMHSGELGALRIQESVGKSFSDIRLSDKGVGKYIPSPELFGKLSEKSNRLHSALTAIHLNRDLKLPYKDLYAKTVDFIRRADFPYSKASRQQIARGPSSAAFVFKSYLQNYLFGFMPYLYENSKPAAFTAALSFVALAGAAGLPGYNLLRKTLPGILPGDSRQNMQKLIDMEDEIDEKTAGLLLHGLPAVFDIDGASWFGFSDVASLVPVSLSENIYRNIFQAIGDGSIDEGERWKRLLPTYIKHWFQMKRINDTGTLSTDRYGAPTLTEQDIKRFSAEIRDWGYKQYGKLLTPEDMDQLERALYTAIGTPSLTLSRHYRKVQDIKQMSEGVKSEKGEMNRRVAQIFQDYMPSMEWADDVEGMTPAEFRDNFWDIVDEMPQEAQDELDSLIDEYYKQGLKFNTGSIHNAILERIERIKIRLGREE